MITIKAIFDEHGTAYPSEIVDTSFGKLFDGTNFIYFETEQEVTEFYNSLNNQI